MFDYKAELVRVVDGDTVVLDIDLGFHIHVTKRVRFDLIDAIERKDDPTRAATQEVIDWFASVDNKVFVRTKLDKEDMYGRVIGSITPAKIDERFVKGGYDVSLSKNMVDRGFAVFKDYRN